jgi:RNA polymerase-binding transcription factor DksA
MAEKSKSSSKAKPSKHASPKANGRPAAKAKAADLSKTTRRPTVKAPVKTVKTPEKAAETNGSAPVRVIDPKTRLFFERQKVRLLDLRDHFLDQMQSVAQDSLRSRAENNEASAVGQHQADAGSDAYEKDFALSLLSQEQDALYEIEEALKRIEVGSYGVCEMSNKAIPHARLEAIPFARFTVECQQQLEKENKGRRRWETAPQFMDSAETFADEEEESIEDDDKKKEKD